MAGLGAVGRFSADTPSEGQWSISRPAPNLESGPENQSVGGACGRPFGLMLTFAVQAPFPGLTPAFCGPDLFLG
jgi:hypothetical protein